MDRCVRVRDRGLMPVQIKVVGTVDTLENKFHSGNAIDIYRNYDDDCG